MSWALRLCYGATHVCERGNHNVAYRYTRMLGNYDMLVQARSLTRSNLSAWGCAICATNACKGGNRDVAFRHARLFCQWETSQSRTHTQFALRAHIFGMWFLHMSGSCTWGLGLPDQVQTALYFWFNKTLWTLILDALRIEHLSSIHTGLHCALSKKLSLWQCNPAQQLFGTSALVAPNRRASHWQSRHCSKEDYRWVVIPLWSQVLSDHRKLTAG